MKSQRRKPRSKKGSLALDVKRSAYFVMIFVIVVLAFEAVALLFFPNTATDVDALTAATSLAFPASAIIYLRVANPDRKKGIVERLGLGLKGLSPGNIMLGVYIFIIIFSLELLVGLFSTVTGVSINTNAEQIFVSAPLWFYFFTAVVAPIDEEILFRGLMVPRLGIIASALIFGLLHYSYNSTYGIEIVAALVFGLIAGYVYRKTGSIYPSIVAHIMVNALTVISAYSLLVLWVH